jgi:hypothetical protein
VPYKWEPKVGDGVTHVYTKAEGNVVTVDTYWEWFEVEWDNGRFQRYTFNTQMVKKRKSPQEERADQRLREESMGLTDDWREYDGEEV